MSPVIYIGNSCIGLAVGLSLFGIIAFYAGRRVESETAASLGRAAVYGNFILMTIANLAMIYALLGNDFGVSYVAHVGSRETPRWISVISLWSSLEGSILFWGWILSAYSAVCIYLYREREERLFLWVGLTLLAVQLFFYLLLALPANPFMPVVPPPANGPGPNPLLQNHWLMALHPPCLYMGYIGFTLPFAFAIAALMETDLPGQWVALTRRWTLFAWSFQSIAIVLGGWWSYAVLGWGGYWAWDPVENASFMPWLAGTALVHSIMVQEKRKLLPVWNLSLAILTFLLTLLGTFLTRSGVLDSVHSFTESHVGPYFLIFIGVVLAASLALLLWKGSKFREPGRFENLLSLEVLFLFNNLLFLSFCFIVFLGTLYPLVVEAVKGTRISVGEPYFNQMTVPITGMILFLMGVALITPWRKGSPGSLWKSAKLPASLAAVVAIIAAVLGGRTPWVTAIIFLAAFAFFIMFLEMARMSRKRSFFRLFADNPRRYGGFVAHTGALMIIVAVALSATYEREQEIALKKGESAQVRDYTLTLEEIGAEETPQRFEIKALVKVSREGEPVERLIPQMNFYPNSREPIGSPAVRSTLMEDLYVTLIHFEKDGSSASLRAIVTPAVAWIWIGGGVVMLGGLLALSLGRKKSEEAV
jgi:cytochrome c-type biogenesis protein CcmF